jgi:hypothetical protein
VSAARWCESEAVILVPSQSISASSAMLMMVMSSDLNRSAFFAATFGHRQPSSSVSISARFLRHHRLMALTERRLPLERPKSKRVQVAHKQKKVLSKDTLGRNS